MKGRRSYRWRELERLLLRNGFLRRETGSSHAVYRHPASGLGTTLVMKHPGERAKAGAVQDVLTLVEEVKHHPATRFDV